MILHLAFLDNFVIGGPFKGDLQTHPFIPKAISLELDIVDDLTIDLDSRISYGMVL